MNEDVRAEHQRLLAETQALEREHRTLEQKPRDLEAHAAHRAKLRQQIDQLHAHMRRLREESDLQME